MYKFLFLAGLLPVLALASCSDEGTTSISDVSLGPETGTITQARGAMVAQRVCAPCHGSDFSGAELAGTTCPSLTVVRLYSLDEFDTLLLEGTDPQGDPVNRLMSDSRGLSVQDRHALYEYLHWFYAQ